MDSSLSDTTSRSRRVKRSLSWLFLLKGLSVVLNLLLIRISLDYLDGAAYGVWLTISSILGWVGSFDLGITNGFRNRFAEAQALGDKVLATELVSTTYVVVGGIVLISGIVLVPVVGFLNWQAILNATFVPPRDLAIVLVLGVATYFIRTILRISNTILIASQKPEQSDLLDVLALLFTLAGLLAVSMVTHGSVLVLGLVFVFSPTVVFLAANFWLFHGRYAHLRPSISRFNSKLGRSLTTLSSQFFVITFAGLIIFSASNLIIIQFVGPSEVTSYNIAFRYFSSIIMIFGVFISPMWSAFTEALVKNDIGWIRSSMRRLIRIWGMLAILTVGLLLVSPTVYSLWLGGTVQIQFGISAACAVYVTLFNWSALFASFINGAGKIRVQTISAAIVMMMFIPLAIVGVHVAGSIGVIGASCVCLLVGAIWAPMQTHLLISGQAKGLWAK